MGGQDAGYEWQLGVWHTGEYPFHLFQDPGDITEEEREECKR